jgi:hypothetical protein
MRTNVASCAVLVAVVAGCGAYKALPANDVRACVKEHLPPGAVDRVFVNTEEGVTSVNYYHRGAETDVTIFNSAADAEEAEKAEARLGDAHDRRVANVLYSGGGAVERAITTCLH